MRLSIVLLLVCSAPPVAQAELTSRQRRMVQTVNATVKQAGTAYAAEKYDQAANSIELAIKQIEAATGEDSPELYDQLLPAMQRIAKAHTLLEFEGIALPPFRRPKRPEESGSSKPRPEMKPRPRPSRPSEPKPVPPPSEMAPSFTKTVAPILVNRCGRCHVSQSKGQFNLATYAALMKGPPEGVVIFAGDTVGSRLIETIETGDMPRGGSVPPAELQTLKAWIVAGAKFDGVDPNAPLAGDAAPAADAPAPRLAVSRATGNETVSFAGDVAPLLVEHCTGCHIDAAQDRGGLRMDTFARLLRGGDSGQVIVPGQGQESLLVKKLRGMEGQQMPSGGRDPLSEESIRLITTWIDEGATLDGESESQPLSVMSQLAWAASATAEQISQRRQELADRHLQLVTRGTVQSHATNHFLVTGPASDKTLELVGRLAEDQMKTVNTVVSAEPGEAFYHGKATLFVLPKRYEYSEFAKMVEDRGVPASWMSHWKFDGIDAYVALVVTDRDDEEEIASRLAAPLVSLAVATRGGQIPRWLSEGIGVATSNRTGNLRDRDARRKVESEISEALAAMEDAKQFLGGKLSPEHTDRIGAAISASLLDRTQRRNFDALLRDLANGKPFDQAFLQAFRVTPVQFVESWIGWARGR